MNENSVAVIGAGPSGLSAARILKALNIPFRVYEKHSNVGGLWDIDNPGTPMYKSAHFISSKTMSAFKGYPMPDNYPDYPSRIQIHKYLENFANDHQLYNCITFNCRIEKITFEHDLWKIKTQAGEEHLHRWLICASGALWDPNRPSLAGEENFKSEIIHAVQYKNSDLLKNKRVLVVGAGNSGVDIACDAAFAADKAFISLRRGYHFVPKHIFGMPADVFGAKSGGGPMWLSQWFFSKLLRIMNGKLSRLGLPEPDHKVLSSHPIMNTQILHYLQHGDLTAKKDVDYLQDHKVFFKDGSSEEVDLIILATGYHCTIPYLDTSFFEWENHRPQLYLKFFNPNHPSLFAMGLLETNGGGYDLFDEMNYLAAKTIESQLKENPLSQKIKQTINQPAPDLSGNIKFVNSERHTGYVNKDTYLKELKKFRKKMNWEPLESLLQKGDDFVN